VVGAELKATKHLKKNMMLAREKLNLATEDIRSKVMGRGDGVDRLTNATRSLYRVLQNKVLKDAEVSAMTLDLVRMRDQLH
jgi:hypothetical protein